MKPPRQRVAIVGSGMAGLVAGYLLANDKEARFDVEVLEMQDRLSLDSASYTLPRESSRHSPGSTSGTGTGRTGDGSRGGVTHHPAKLQNASEEMVSEDENEGNESEERVDLPMRAFAAGYYDNLRKLYSHLGVHFDEPRFVYSLSTLDSTDDDAATKKRAVTKGGNYFIHSSNNHILPPIRPVGLSIARWVVEVAYLLFWYTWFTLAAFVISPGTIATKTTTRQKDFYTSGGLTTTTTHSSETLRSYLSRIMLPKYYITRYFLPLMSSVTTCTHDELLDFPASDIVAYARRTFRRPHYTVRGGVRQAEGKLSAGLRVRFGAKVVSVTSLTDGRVKVRWRVKSTSVRTHSSSARVNGGAAAAGHDGAESRVGAEAEGLEILEEIYDKAIIAVTPDVVGSIFQPLATEMKDIPTTSVQSVVHQDFARIGACSAQLRRNPRFASRATSSSSSSTSAPGPISAAIHMYTDLTTGKTESIHEHLSSMLITTYPLDSTIDPSKILHRATFTRVLRNPRSRAIVSAIFEPQVNAQCHNAQSAEANGWRNGDGNVYLVGGWCWDGMVMLEGCIVSAIRVADALGVDVPWAR
ncbi:hypothetical protein BJY00DRAFT_283591 [Aspergillus carlsbadensis]|nr:hypothetical protein BJY00DRAFT_283591 [Aspergillus carlsbadensis]